MPVGKGSIARATNASINNGAVTKTTVREMPNILSDIPINQIQSVPLEWISQQDQHNTGKELVQSIQRFGMLEPVILRRLTDNQFQLLSGYRRLQAMKEMGFESITSRVLDDINDGEAMAIFQELHKKEKVATQNIQEKKFKAVSTISRDLPAYLL